MHFKFTSDNGLENIAKKSTGTNYYKNSFSYSGAILWNSLPCNLGKQSPLGNLNDYSKNCKARHSWKAAFLMKYFYYISIRHF